MDDLTNTKAEDIVNGNLKIRIKHGICILELTSEEIEKIYSDYMFLRDAILSLINPEVADKSDLDFSNKTYKEYIKKYFQENPMSNSKDFLNNIFGEQLQYG
jgi:hypothetical protein